MSLEKINEFLIKFGLPEKDNYELPTSGKKFPDGAHFRTEELPKTVEDYEKLFTLCEKYDYTVNKITDTRGIIFDTEEEILKKLELAREHRVEVIMAPGAGERPFDISQQFAVGAMTPGKIRGMDQMVNTIRNMLYAIELGCRGFLIYDEGLLFIACKMREESIIPPETKFKISAVNSLANPSSIKFYCNFLNKNDSINPVRDLTFPMISAIREVTEIPFDIHIFWRSDIARSMDAHKIVRIGSPVYLKNARRSNSFNERFLQGVKAVQFIDKYYPEAKQSRSNANDLAIPVKRGVKW